MVKPGLYTIEEKPGYKAQVSVSRRGVKSWRTLYECFWCGRELRTYGHKEYEDVARTICTQCKRRAGMVWTNKDELYTQLARIQSGKCIVPYCSWEPSLWWRKVRYRPLCLHRIVPGRDGGEYTLDNTVLVCPEHHGTIEGMTRRHLGLLWEVSETTHQGDTQTENYGGD